jgi:hypothetical protein
MEPDMSFDPKAVQGVLDEYGLESDLVESEEPDIDPTTIELSHGLAIVFDDSMSLLQDSGGQVHQRGDFDNLSHLIEAIGEYIELGAG